METVDLNKEDLITIIKVALYRAKIEGRVEVFSIAEKCIAKLRTNDHSGYYLIGRGGHKP